MELERSQPILDQWMT